MLGVSEKPAVLRMARTEARSCLSRSARTAVEDASARKGDALSVAQLAEVGVVTRVAELIPPGTSSRSLASGLASTGRQRSGDRDGGTRSRPHGGGGEIEAMTTASVAALALYDMLKSVERDGVIGSVRWLEERGGESGVWEAAR